MSLKFKPLCWPQDGALIQFFTAHDDARRSGFITHLDRSPIAHKRKAFYKGLLMNIVLTALIAWLVTATLLRDLFASLDTPVMMALHVTQDLVIAWAIYSMLMTTTIPFFFGECRLRARCGFRPVEILFRRPPTLPSGLSDEEQIDHYRRFVSRAMDPYLIYSNAWTFLTCELWTSSHSTMMDAYVLVDHGDIDQTVLESAFWKLNDDAWSFCTLNRVDSLV